MLVWLMCLLGILALLVGWFLVRFLLLCSVLLDSLRDDRREG